MLNFKNKKIFWWEVCERGNQHIQRPPLFYAV